ncbi:MAG: PKD domain-containing protein, partial [Bacteroidia bacterium]
AIGDYDKTGTLIIDPVPWTIFFGTGTSSDATFGYAIANDASGNLSITGKTTSIFTTTGVYQTSYGGNTDVFIANYGPSGNLQWTTYYGGSSTDVGYGIAIDASSNIFITGFTWSSSVIASSGAYQPTLARWQNAFVAKFHSSGLRLWGTYFGGRGTDCGNAITLDWQGNVLITGNTTSASGIASSGAYQTTIGDTLNGGDAFIAKFNSYGSFQWATYFGGTSEDIAYGITTDLYANILITGHSISDSVIATTGSYQVNRAGSSDVFIAKFNISGSRIWATYYGGSSDENANGIKTDGVGNIYITGNTLSSSGIATSGAYQTTYGGSGHSDAFITKFNVTGSLQWATYFGGSNDDIGNGITTDAAGNVLIVGTTGSTSGIASSGSIPTTIPNGDQSAFYAKFDPYGVRVWSTYYHNRIDEGHAVITDASNNVYVTGMTSTSAGSSTTPTYVAFFKAFVNTGGVTNIANNTISGSQTICRVPISLTLNGSAPTGAYGTYSYKWKKSAFCCSGYTNAGGNDTTQNYTPVITGSTYFKRIVFSGTLVDTSASILIRADVIPDFSINNSKQCLISNQFLFNDVSQVYSGTVSRKWNFGTGVNDTSSALNPVKVYSNPGTFAVKLVCYSGLGCADSITKTVTVGLKPNPGFTINDSSQCVNGNNFIFSDTSTISNGTSSSFWNFGSGTNDTSTSSVSGKTYLSSGTYSVKLVETSNIGCKDSVTQNITVNPKPNVGFTQNIFAQCLSGNNFMLTDTSTISSGTISRAWDFGDMTNSTISNPNKNYLNAGNYPIKLLVTSNNNCKDSISKIVTVYSQPKAGFSQNSLIQCLIGNSFFFDDTSGTSVNRIWNLGDFTTNTNDTFSKSYASAGTFNVKLKIIDSHSCSDSITKPITIKPNPVQPTITPLTKSLLQSSVADSYQWFLNSYFIPGATSQTLSLGTNGTYHVKIDSINGCSNTSNPFTALAVGVDETGTSEEIKIYPNPNNGKFMVNFNSLNGEKLISVFDIHGKLISSLSTSKNEMEIESENVLTKGFYILRIQTEKGMMHSKIFVE